MHTNAALPLSHWGFHRWPFPALPAADQIYPTEAHSEAIARIEHLVDARRRLGVLLGEPGVGKTLLLQSASRKLARSSHAVVRSALVGLSTRELLWQVAAGLGASPRDDDDTARLWRLITDRVIENRVQGVHTILLLDDVGQAGPDLITQLVRLTRLDPSPASRWTIVLTAEPAQARRWNESLRELIDLRIDLPPWAEADTIGFVQTALLDAGCTMPVFGHAALATLHERSGGVPRNVTRLADLALLAGAAAGATTIDTALIHAAHEETNWALEATLV